MTSKLLKEAIADAKAVRETALANAKIALEEAFTPKLQSMLSRKLKEELEGEEEDELTAENDVSSEIGKGDNKQPAKKAFDTAAASDELSAADVEAQSAGVGEEDENTEVLADLSEGEELDIELSEEDEFDPTGAAPETAGNEPEATTLESEDEYPVDEEEEFELDQIIKELEDEAAADEHPVAEEEEFHTEEPIAEEGEMAGEEEIDLDEILKEMGYGDDEPVAEEDEFHAEDEVLEIEDGEEAPVTEEELAQLEKEVQEKEAELKEAYNVIRSLKGTINEVNLLNAKLLYVNKLFRSYNLTNEQKTKVVETLDRTKNVREVKLVYSTIAESFKVGHSGKKQISKLTESYNTRIAKSTAPAKKVITESTIADRFKKLAGIVKK